MKTLEEWMSEEGESLTEGIKCCLEMTIDTNTDAQLRTIMTFIRSEMEREVATYPFELKTCESLREEVGVTVKSQRKCAGMMIDFYGDDLGSLTGRVIKAMEIEARKNPVFMRYALVNAGLHFSSIVNLAKGISSTQNDEVPED